MAITVKTDWNVEDYVKPPDMNTIGQAINERLPIEGGAITGDLAIGGTLGVTGHSTLGTVQAGNTNVTGTLGVSGQSTLGALTAGSTSIGGTLGVSGATTLAGLSAGASTLASLGVTGNTTVGGTLGVTGATTMNALTVNQTANFNSTANAQTPTTASGIANKQYVDSAVNSATGNLPNVYAPINHRSSAGTYGLGNLEYYGHVALDDSVVDNGSTSSRAVTGRAVRTYVQQQLAGQTATYTSVQSGGCRVTFIKANGWIMMAIQSPAPNTFPQSITINIPQGFYPQANYINEIPNQLIIVNQTWGSVSVANTMATYQMSVRFYTATSLLINCVEQVWPGNTYNPDIVVVTSSLAAVLYLPAA